MNITMNLYQRINHLYRKTGKLNLYISLLNREDKSDMQRIKREMKDIKMLAMSIENEIKILEK